MQDPTFENLPILSELGDELNAAFSRHLSSKTSRFWESRRVTKLILRVAVAACVIGAAVAFVDPFSSDVPATAAAALTQIANNAEKGSGGLPLPGQFYFVKSKSVGLATIQRNPDTLVLADHPYQHAIVTSIWETWVSPYQTGQVTSRVLSVKFPTAAARAAWVRDGRPSFGPGPKSSSTAALGSTDGKFLIGDLDLTRSQVLALTTSPRRLYAKLYTAGHDRSWEVFNEICAALSALPVTAKLRATLYRTLSLVPHIRLLGDTHDSLGRSGVAVALNNQGVEQEEILDPKNGALLETRQIELPAQARASGIKAGTASTTTYLDRRLTDGL